MCDDLLSHHHRISSPTHIPLSNAPTWFTTQHPSNRSLNRTWLFLPPDSIGQINFTKFFEINPKWSVYSFDKRVLRFFDKSSTAEMVYEMRLSGPRESAPVEEDRWISTLKIVEDAAWFCESFPERAACAGEEDVISLIDPVSSVRLGHVTFLGDAKRLFISSVVISESYAHSYREREIERRLLLAVVGIAEKAGLRVWVAARAEDVERLGVYFRLGFVVNRTMWVVERNEVEKEEEKEGSGWSLGNWEGGMVGWREQWAAALDMISAGKA